MKYPAIYYYIQNVFNFYPREIYRKICSISWFLKSKRDFKKLQKVGGEKDFPISRPYPCLLDRYEEGGSASGHYFHQDFLVAQKIYKNKPVRHVDIGSRIDGFVAHVASFREITIVDIRDVTSTLPNIEFIQADCMDPDFKYVDYCDSASSLHAIEHFGLGRYCDKLDPDGHIKGLENIYKMLKKGGKFYFSVPIGEQRIEFNAHRIFSVKYLLDYFSDKYDLESFSYVDDKGELYREISLTEELINNNCGCQYGCGIFELIKK